MGGGGRKEGESQNLGIQSGGNLKKKQEEKRQRPRTKRRHWQLLHSAKLSAGHCGMTGTWVNTMRKAQGEDIKKKADSEGVKESQRGTRRNPSNTSGTKLKGGCKKRPDELELSLKRLHESPLEEFRTYDKGTHDATTKTRSPFFHETLMKLKEQQNIAHVMRAVELYSRKIGGRGPKSF